MKAQYAYTGLGCFGVVAALLGGLLVPKLVEDKIAAKVAIKADSEAYDRWKETPVPMYISVYVFHVANAKEVTEKGKRPVVEEKGPYVYKVTRVKEDVKLEEDEDRAVYFQKVNYDFMRNLSIGDDSDKYTVVNIPALAYGQIIESIPGIANSLTVLDGLLRFMWPRPDPIFVEESVRDYVFDGIKMNCKDSVVDDPLQKVMFRLMCKSYERIHPRTVTIGPDGTNRFALFGYKRDTLDGPYEVRLGIDEPEKIGEIKKWRGEASLLDTWGEPECNELQGTDSTIFRPFLHNVKSLKVFNSDACRSMSLVYKEDTEFKGVPGRRYVLEPTTLGSVTKHPKNYCYCPRSVVNLTSYGGCLRTGLQELSTCQGAPVLLSLPHLLTADSDYTTKVLGLSPDVDKHSLFVDLEPNTGYPLRGAMRVQMNVNLKRIPGLTTMKRYPSAVLPVFWFDESVELSEKLIDQLKDELLGPLEWAGIAKWVAVGFGTGIAVISIALLIRPAFR